MLRKYYQTVTLTGEQKDRLIQKYWEANKEERVGIVKAYAHVFGKDAEFAQRLMLYHDLRKQQMQPQQGASGSNAIAAGRVRSVSGSGSSGTASPLPEGLAAKGAASPTSPHSPTGSFSTPTLSLGASSGPRLTHSQLLLRTAIQDQFQILSGPGPYPISFGIVATDHERKEVIDLYASQFLNPDPPELHRLVQLPQSLSTRTRRRINGSYSFYIRCHPTGDVVCAVTIIAHHHQTHHHFAEMPLFATAAGYKKNGFGRLLNAALAEWGVAAGFEFTMISADVQAIPFWQHMGYEMMSKQEKNGIAFFYDHECYKFHGAEPMIGYCSRQRHRAPPTSGVIPLCEQSVAGVLRGMPKVVIAGPLELPSV